MVDFLSALIKLFRYLLRIQSYEVKCVQLGCFRDGSTSLHSNFTGPGSSPSTILGIKKLETLGYPTVKTASLCIIPECDGQTDFP